MSVLHIFSWNAQGGSGNEQNYRAETKKNLLMQHVIDRIRKEPCMILLQEAGVPDTTGYQEGDDVGFGFCCIYAGEDVTADYQRCTIAVLANFPEQRLIEKIYTGYTGRLVPIFNVWGRFLLLTAHLNAGGDALQEAAALLDTVINNAKLPWFMAGDFNSEPLQHERVNCKALNQDCFNLITYGGTARRPKRCQVFVPSEATQGAGGIRINKYDYAFCSEGEWFELLGYDNILVEDPEDGRIYSDHNLMYFSLSVS